MKKIQLEDGGVRILPVPALFEASVKAARAAPGKLPLSGDLELREGFRRLWIEKTRTDVPLESLAVTHSGSSTALQVALGWATDDGKKAAAAFSPLWFGFGQMCKAQKIPLFVAETTVENGFLPSAEMIEKIGATNGGALIVNQFGTPAGALFDERKLRQIADMVRDTPNLVLIEDAVMWMNSQEAERFPTLLRVAPDLWEEGRLIGCASLTKAWGVGEIGGEYGMSIGFLWGPEKFMEWAFDITADPAHDWTADYGLQIGMRHAFGDVGLAHMAETVAGIERNVQMLQAICGLTGFDLYVRPMGGSNALLGVSRIIGKTFRGRTLETEKDVVTALNDAYLVETYAGSAFHALVPSIRVNLGGASCDDFRIACERLVQFNAELC